MIKIEKRGGGGGSINAQDILSWRGYVKDKIKNLYETAPDVTLTTAGATDLQTAITALTDGQLLEIKVDAVYSQIIIPAAKAFSVRVAYGYNAQITGAQSITLNNGVNGVLISGLNIETHSGGTTGKGSAVCFEHQAIVEDVIFHNMTISNIPAAGASILLSYHQSIAGDNYATANALNEFSTKIAFVDCDLYKASDGLEFGAITVRGCDLLYLSRNKIDGQNNSTDSRGVLAQNCFNVLAEDNDIMNTYIGNGEGIKIDRIGAPVYFNTCWIKNNRVHHCIEGIDVDDSAEARVEDNQVWDCDTEGISIDNDSKGFVIGNTTFNCNDGIRFENGSTYEVKGNNSFDNANLNYRFDDGVGVADSTNLANPYESMSPLGIINQFMTRWNDLQVPLTAGQSGLTSPPTFNVLRGALRAWDFSIGDELFFGIHVPHDYKEGTIMYPHVHWTSDGVDVNIVRWALEYEVVKVAAAFPVGTTTINIDGTPSGVAYTHYIDEDATGIAEANIDIGAYILCRLARVTNAGTDNTDAIFGLEVDFHYQIENTGTYNRMPPLNNRLIP